MLTKLATKNFKAFPLSEIEIKPITVILGSNNSGKSSLLAPLRILSQTIQSYDRTIPFLLNGILGDFGTYKDIVYSNNKKRIIEICLHFTSSAFSGEKNKQYKMHLKFKYRTTIRETVLSELKILSGKEILLQTSYSEDTEKYIIHYINNKEIPNNLKSAFSKNFDLFHFLPNSIRIFSEKKGPLKEFIDEKTNKIMRNLPFICNDLFRFLNDLEYVGAMRLPPERTYTFSGDKNKHIGINGENAIKILTLDSMRKGSKTKSIRENVTSWLNKANIASDLLIDVISDRYYELKIQNPFTKEYQNYSDVGYGNSQVIPILVAGYNLHENRTLIVEQPEIHLHPQAQAALGDFFLDLYKTNKKSIIETHSEYLILRLQQHIASGKINEKDVVFYCVYPDKEIKNIKKIRIDNNGKFIDPWPKGFFPERLNESKELSKIRFFKVQK